MLKSPVLGQLFLLLNQQPEYQGFLDDFFRRREHLPHLAFLHHLSIGNLKTAASDLLRAGANNSKIDARKVSSWVRFDNTCVLTPLLDCRPTSVSLNCLQSPRESAQET